MDTTQIDQLPVWTWSKACTDANEGDLLLCSGRYLVSRLIRLASRSPFSHVGVIWRWNGELMLFESVETDGVRAIPLNQYLENFENSGKAYPGDLYLARVEGVAAANPASPRAIFESAIKRLNRDFNLWEMVQMTIQLLLPGIFRHFRSKQYLCSEFVDEVFHEAKKIKFASKLSGFLFPEDIASDLRVEGLCRLVQPAKAPAQQSAVSRPRG
jgi:hypothetical protein